ncbi:MAG: ACT domain-containing protein [Eubacterium sp.]|nr:ACT domain-containing protein [Eubacterium sp.]
MTTYMEKHSVDGMAVSDQDLLISLKKVPVGSNILNRCLSALSEADVNVDIITQTAPVKNAIDVSFIVYVSDLAKVRDIINALGEEYPEIKLVINKDITRISVSGIGMRTQSGVSAKFFQAMADNDIQILMITTSEISISCIIRSEDAPRAIEATRAAFQLV